MKANREADLTFSRAINPTGKINQNIRPAGLAGSGWQETSQVGLTNAYQNALNTNTSDYNNAVKELNLAISQAKQSGDIATMQAIQTYAIQLAQQLYQEARAAVADAQWEKSYALQKAAFDLEHASQTNNNSGYSVSYPSYSTSTSGGTSGNKYYDANGNFRFQASPESDTLHAQYAKDENGDWVWVPYYTDPAYPGKAESYYFDPSQYDDILGQILFEANVPSNTYGKTETQMANILMSYVAANEDNLSAEDWNYLDNQYGINKTTVDKWFD